MTCPHMNFAAEVDVNRLTDMDGPDAKVNGYMADIRIRCHDCGEQFRFIGLPAGCDTGSPTVSVDGCEGRFPILPKSMSLSELEGTPIGFTIRKVK